MDSVIKQAVRSGSLTARDLQRVGYCLKRKPRRNWTTYRDGSFGSMTWSGLFRVTLNWSGKYHRYSDSLHWNRLLYRSKGFNYETT